jgi:hypothetical protein
MVNRDHKAMDACADAIRDASAIHKQNMVVISENTKVLIAAVEAVNTIRKKAPCIAGELIKLEGMDPNTKEAIKKRIEDAAPDFVSEMEKTDHGQKVS